MIHRFYFAVGSWKEYYSLMLWPFNYPVVLQSSIAMVLFQIFGETVTGMGRMFYMLECFDQTKLIVSGSRYFRGW